YSVQCLVQSPLTKGLFKRAIQQSAGGYQAERKRDFTKETASRMGAEFVRQLGVQSLDELCDLPFEKIIQLQAQWKYEENGLECRFAPSIDGNVLTDTSDHLFESDAYAHVDYLVGCTENDIGVTPEMKANHQKGQLYGSLKRLCLLQDQLGRTPAYMYYFTHSPLGDDLGSFHSSELWYMFGTLGRSWRPKSQEDYALSSQMLDFWANFIKTGNPNQNGSSAWRPCTNDDPYIQTFV
ncbi:MAG: carboxylesterase family protein, partial [Clostridia bacterium]|nr:carboxylesterase family protein [Clostridia bacterium]